MHSLLLLLITINPHPILKCTRSKDVVGTRNFQINTKEDPHAKRNDLKWFGSLEVMGSVVVKINQYVGLPKYVL